jgi:nicotinic acid mononucleotide adenylyltransferase
VLLGRVTRFSAQLLFNLSAFGVLSLGGVFGRGHGAPLGGVLHAAFLTTLASLGAQEIAIRIALSGRGDQVRNVQFGLSANVVATAAATAGATTFAAGYSIAAGVLGAMGLGAALYSDFRVLFPGRGGVACLLGTFNPIHREHLALALRALTERGLSKVYIHPTGIPQIHRAALEQGEIRVARVESGFCVYERTEKADAAVDYFPTGNKFLHPETRIELIRLAIRDEGLEGRVEPLWLPDAYAKNGFPAVLDEIRKRHPDEAIHVLHGNDVGGFLVRAIGDAWGLWPRTRAMPVKRTPGVSATAIRAGALGLTTHSVEFVLDAMRLGRQRIRLLNRDYFIDEQFILRSTESV